ncbi:alpha/beta fold hydrolase [Streptantibioticus silvisoli]|uniref:Alpha/beta hydrolase n=1 Tax=Streptantibioticus silvisoli TaxID=2705255 RepID=A0ABT6VVE8_9ACTN|nr:alpha/beta hydrolase [Streptantibioticus silvisoli]MDI5962453.1 alpha/beta hydrolase [Streptantibioticus silvisoli]
MGVEITTHVLDSPRHRTSYLSAGPPDGPLMFFVHGFPGLGAMWRPQLDHFAERGWHCVAPDMRGYGGSSVPTGAAAYAVAEVVDDMVELHDALGGRAAVWVGHDWGSEVVWSMAVRHAERCRAVVSLTVPYIPGGLTLEHLTPLVDRSLYPVEVFPLGQWEYMQLAIDEPELVAEEFAADLEATFAVVFRGGDPMTLGTPSFTSIVRAQGGWFGPSRRAPKMDRDETVLSEELLDTLVRAYGKTGFLGPHRWYANAGEELRAGRPGPGDSRVRPPVLFVHASWDPACETVTSRLAEPMREACDDLTEVVIDAGHWVALEKPGDVNAGIADWLGKTLRTGPHPM